MIIGIDGNEANVEKRVGISEYAFELLFQFQKFKTQSLRFIIYLKEPPKAHMPTPTFNFSYKVVGPKKMWTQFGLPISLYLNKSPDVFFSPTHYAPRFSPIPTAISIMDLSYEHFPALFAKKDLYQLKNWTRYSAKKAKAIFTISEFSKNDIIKMYAIDAENVHVTYPGIRSSESSSKASKVESMDEISKKFGIKGDYILFVGTLQPRKNIEKLIEAFASLKRDSLQLVIVGKKGWLYEDILSAPKRFGIEDKVKFLDFVTDSQLPALYKNALCFVLPSLYEGFGLPVLEAMKNGCPVITSNVSSLPEAGGDAAFYFNPEKTEDIAAKIKEVVDSPELRKEMVKKGYEQVKKFSWEKTARKTLDILQELSIKK